MGRSVLCGRLKGGSCRICDEASPLTAEEAMKLGYRKTSNRYRHVSRIDRADWVKHLAKYLMRSPAELYQPGSNTPDVCWADHYRRVLSMDTITMRCEEFSKMKSSNDDVAAPVAASPINERAQRVRDGTRCLSGVANCTVVCDICKDSTERSFRDSLKFEIDAAKRLLQSYGYYVG